MVVQGHVGIPRDAGRTAGDGGGGGPGSAGKLDWCPRCGSHQWAVRMKPQESGERVGRDEKGLGLGVGRLPTRQGFSREKALWVMRFRLGKIK